MDPPYDDRKKKDWEQTIVQFVTDYERNYSLSSFGWRLLFARLLFPPHYFETVERYYQTGNEEQKAYIETLRSHFTRCEPLRAIYEAFLWFTSFTSR